MSDTPRNLTAHELAPDGLQGRPRGRSTVVGNLVVPAILAGAISGSAAVAGDLTSYPSGAGLSGAVSGSAAVSGDLTSFPSGSDLAGDATGSATVAGDLTSYPALPGAELQGTVAGTATLTGDLVVGDSLFGTITGTSLLTGDLGITVRLSGAAAGSAILTGDLTGKEPPAALAGAIFGQATLTGAFPSTLKPRFAVSKDLFNMLQSTEFGFDATYNSLLPIKVIYKDLSNGILGGTVNLKGEEITMYAWHEDIQAVQEGDTITIDTWTFTVREVEPNNHGIVRLKMEEA